MQNIEQRIGHAVNIPSGSDLQGTIRQKKN